MLALVNNIAIGFGCALSFFLLIAFIIIIMAPTKKGNHDERDRHN